MVLKLKRLDELKSNTMNVTKIAVEDVMTLIIILVILFLFCLLLARNNDAYNKLRNRVLIPLTAIAGFIIYYIGYQELKM